MKNAILKSLFVVMLIGSFAKAHDGYDRHYEKDCYSKCNDKCETKCYDRCHDRHHSNPWGKTLDRI